MLLNDIQHLQHLQTLYEDIFISVGDAFSALDAIPFRLMGYTGVLSNCHYNVSTGLPGTPKRYCY